MDVYDAFMPASGAVSARRYYDGPAVADSDNGVFLHARLFTYTTNLGLVAGWTMSVMFCVDAPTRVVWPVFKDFNNWQKNSFYSGIVGDLEGQIYTTGVKPNDVDSPFRRQVLKVIPEHLIVTGGLIPPEGTKWPGLPGLGGVCPGFSAFMLSEHAGRTHVSVTMEHASYASRGTEMSDEEAIAPWRGATMDDEWLRKWKDEFVPTLKSLVAKRAGS